MGKLKNIILLDKPAKKWDDGLPVGNGRLGAMVMGKVLDETIFINEETLWYGEKRNRSNPDAKENISAIRKMLLEGEVENAAFLAKMAMTSTPKYNNPYQPAGDLRLGVVGQLGKISGYKRYLDLDNSVAYVEYTVADIHYKREIIASVKYNVIAIRLTCDKPKKLTIQANMSRKPFEEHTGKLDNSTVANWGQNGAGGVSYFTGVRMAASGSEVSTMGDFCYAQNADEIVVYLNTLTDFGGCSDLKKECIATLDAAQNAGFDKILKAHIEEYKSLSERTRLSIEADNEKEQLPTSEMLALLKAGDEGYLDYLTVLLFNYAKYLMISSSYKSKLPANLQGIWNGSYDPPWQSEFTININLEMNYWFVDKCGLFECNEPLFGLIDRLCENGKKTAAEIYGCKGSCAHHNTNLWACSDIEGIFDASPFWVMGEVWLSLHLFEHYEYTRDIEFLRKRALPIMEQSVLFFEDYLYQNEDGLLLTGPSLSPENTYISDKNQKGALCMAPTMDTMLLRQLFKSYIEGMKTAYPDKSTEKITAMLEGLPKTEISGDGRIREWYKDYTEVEPGHRHISHLYGLHPGNEITKENKPLFEAARKTLEYRLANGGGHTGWSKAWVCCFYSRLRDGAAFHKNLTELLKVSIQDNLLDMHPPFQIDGNFGIAEAMLESIVQSHGNCIDLLPALPPNWSKGELTGIRLRGGITADIYWENNNLEKLYLTAESDIEVKLCYGAEIGSCELKKGTKTSINAKLKIIL